MSRGYLKQEVRWFTTPERLRELADLLENKAKDNEWGDGTISGRETLTKDGLLTLAIGYDQTELSIQRLQKEKDAR